MTRGRGRRENYIKNVPRENERIKGNMPKNEKEIQESNF